jgi:hypothetical protein
MVCSVPNPSLSDAVRTLSKNKPLATMNSMAATSSGSNQPCRYHRPRTCITALRASGLHKPTR